MHVRGEAAALDQNLEAARDDEMFHFDAVRLVLWREEALGKLLKHLRQTRVKTQAAPEFLETSVCGAVHPEAVQQNLHVGQFVVVALLPHQFLRAFPESPRINAEGRENHLLLHVVGTERLVVIVNNGNDVLRYRHSGQGRGGDAAAGTGPVAALVA